MFGNKVPRDEHDRVLAQLQETQSDLEQLQQREKLADGVLGLVFETLDHPDVEHRLDEEAMAAAAASVAAEAMAGLVKDKEAEALRTVKKRLEQEFRGKEGPGILAERIAALKSDPGKMAQLKAAAEVTVNGELDAAAEDRIRSEFLESLEDPAVRKELFDQLLEKKRESDEGAAILQAVIDETQADWDDELDETLRAEMVAEEGSEDKKNAYMDERRREWNDSWQAKQARQQVRSDLEAKWSDQLKDVFFNDLDEVTKKEVLLEYLELLERENAAKKKEMDAAELLKTFEGPGVDLTAVDNGIVVELVMGDYVPGDINARFADDREPRIENEQRRIKAVSLGEGLFEVVSDSLSSNENEVVRSAAIAEGTIGAFGRHTNNAGKLEFVRRLRADAVPMFDPDTRDPEADGQHYRLADLIIDGVSARDIQYSN